MCEEGRCIARCKHIVVIDVRVIADDGVGRSFFCLYMFERVCEEGALPGRVAGEV